MEAPDVPDMKYREGLKLSDQEILWCVTELVSKEDMDDTVRIAKEVIGA